MRCKHGAFGYEFEVIASRLVKAGADVNKANEDGFTALILAAGKGNTDAVRLLLDNGANAGAKANNGTTALSNAKRGGLVNIVHMLEEHQANLGVRWLKGLFQDRQSRPNQKGTESGTVSCTASITFMNKNKPISNWELLFLTPIFVLAVIGLQPVNHAHTMAWSQFAAGQCDLPSGILHFHSCTARQAEEERGRDRLMMA